MVYSYNSRNQETKAGASSQVQSQHGLYLLQDNLDYLDPEKQHKTTKKSTENEIYNRLNIRLRETY